MIDKLLKSNLFRGCTKNEIEELLSSYQYQIKQYRAGQTVALSGEKLNNLMILLDGSVKAEMIDLSGKIVKIDNISAPEALATAFLFGEKNIFPVYVEATVATKILFISRAVVLEMLSQNTTFLQNFMNDISDRTQLLLEKIRLLSIHTIKKKMIYYLLNLYRLKKSKNIRLDISQQELSEIFGVSRPALSKVVRELDHRKIISARGKNIELIEIERMKEILKK